MTCHVCETVVRAMLFPAMFRKMEQSPDQIVLAGEASCFFHADRVAAIACSRCGRFLCQFCRIKWDREDLCPACLEAANAVKGAVKQTSTLYRYDSLALAISTLPIITFIFTIFTAPLALGIALFTFRKPCSVAPRSKVRFVAAILLSLAQIAGWAIFFVYSFRRRMGVVG